MLESYLKATMGGMEPGEYGECGKGTTDNDEGTGKLLADEVCEILPPPEPQ